MKQTHTWRKWIWLTGLALLLGPLTEVDSRETVAQVEGYRLGSHTQSTRVIIQLNQKAPYRVLTQEENGKVVVWIRRATLKPGVDSQSFKDRYLGAVQVQEIQKNVKFTLQLKDKTLSPVHFIRHRPEQIVIDLKPKTATSKQAVAQPKKPQIASKPIASLKKTAKTENVSQPQSKSSKASAPIVDRPGKTDRESILKSGTRDYERALKLFQNKNYLEALRALEKFRTQYRESRFRGNAAYMIAESHYNLARQSPYPDYEQALAAYLYALRTYPDSNFYDHALFKAASIYEAMNYTLEAKSLYERGLKEDHSRRYRTAREIGLGNMLLAAGKLEEAYRTFQSILRRFPKNAEAKEGLFKIAAHYYGARDYPKALKIFEDVVKRWPDELNEQPEVNFLIGEIYFNRKQYAKARRFYFNLVNLAPDSPNAHRGLNRIGDTYLLEANGMAALTVFNKSYNLNAGTAESQYAQIRLGDVGMRFPGLPVKDIVAGVSPYYHPYRAFDEVSRHPQTREILAEATFSLGSAYYREQRYLEAVEQFKRLLPFETESKFHQWGKKYVQLSIVRLIDQYARQNGHLPALYAYADYLSLNLGEINRVQTQLQIGESYKAIGLYSEALKFFEKVKFSDVNGAFTGRLFLNLGEVHLNENRFTEAERVALTFINNHSGHPRLPDAQIILARAYRGQKRFEQAIEVYTGMLDSPRTEIPRVHYLMAETWFAKNDLTRAADAYRKTLDLYDRSIRNPPDYVQSAYYKLGMVLYMKGKTAESLDALLAGRKLFPEHRLRGWADYLIVDNLDRLQKKDQAEKELKSLVAENRDDLLVKAGQSHLKVIDWEKRLKELL